MSATGQVNEGYGLEQSSPTTAAASQRMMYEIKVAVGVGAIGFAIAFFGAIAFFLRVKLAQLLFGANIWFGVPAADIDAAKLLVMTLQTLAAIAWGLFTAGVAFLFAVAKWMRKI
jgi:hypothetical protein